MKQVRQLASEISDNGHKLYFLKIISFTTDTHGEFEDKIYNITREEYESLNDLGVLSWSDSESSNDELNK